MLFSSINQPRKKKLNQKPTTLSEKKYKKYLRTTIFIKFQQTINIRDSKKMMVCSSEDREKFLDNLNYYIKRSNICFSRHRKSKVIEHIQVPEDKQI